MKFILRDLEDGNGYWGALANISWEVVTVAIASFKTYNFAEVLKDIIMKLGQSH